MEAQRRHRTPTPEKVSAIRGLRKAAAQEGTTAHTPIRIPRQMPKVRQDPKGTHRLDENPREKAKEVDLPTKTMRGVDLLQSPRKGRELAHHPWENRANHHARNMWLVNALEEKIAIGGIHLFATTGELEAVLMQIANSFTCLLYTSPSPRD